jgi:hypothetical protein
MSGGTTRSQSGKGGGATHETPYANDQYFDIRSMSVGQSNGQTIPGAKRHLVTLRNTKQSKKQVNLQDEISVAESALLIAPAKIGSLDVPRLRQHGDKVKAHLGGDLPFHYHAAMFQCKLELAMEQQDPEVTYKLVVCYPSSEADPCSLYSLLLRVNSDKDKFDLHIEPLVDNAQTIEEIKDERTCRATAALLDGFFGNAITNLVSRSMLCASNIFEHLVRSFKAVEKSEDVSQADIPDSVVNAFDDVLKFSRAYCLVVRGIPNFLDASYEDVQDLFANSSKASLSTHLRSAVNAALLNVEFLSLLVEFWDFTAVEADNSAAYWTLHDSLLEHLRKPSLLETPESAKHLLAQLAEHLPVFSDALREGHRKLFELPLYTLVVIKIPNALKDSDFNSDEVKEFHSLSMPVLLIVRGYVRDMGREDLQKEVETAIERSSRALKAADETAAVAGLCATVIAWAGNIDELGEICDKIAGATHASLSSDAVDALEDLRPFIFQAIKRSTLQHIKENRISFALDVVEQINAFPELQARAEESGIDHTQTLFAFRKLTKLGSIFLVRLDKVKNIITKASASHIDRAKEFDVWLSSRSALLSHAKTLKGEDGALLGDASFVAMASVCMRIDRFLFSTF